MNKLLPSQDLAVRHIRELVDKCNEMRLRCYVIAGLPGSGKSYIARHLAGYTGFVYRNLVDEDWSPELAGAESAISFTVNIIRAEGAKGILLLDGLSTLEQLHGTDWTRNLLSRVSEISVPLSVFLLITYDKTPVSAHLSLKSVQDAFNDKGRVVNLSFEFQDAQAFCVDHGVIPKSGSNLFELQTSGSIEGG